MARRNYRYFYLFLTTIAVVGVYMMGCNIAVLVIGTVYNIRVWLTFLYIGEFSTRCMVI